MLCRIGEVEVWRILEVCDPFLAPEVLFPNAGPDVAARIEAEAPDSIDAATGKLILPVQGFLLKTPSHVILVDACIGNHKTNPRLPDWHQRDDGRFLAGLMAAGIGPDDVDYVLCTHLHADHVGWNTRLENGAWVPTFRNARYLLPEADCTAAAAAADPSPMYSESVLPVIAAGQADIVGPDHALGDHVTLVPTPGHTPGHVSLRIASGGAEALITGDAIHSTAQCVYPDWHFRADMDPVEAETSRRALLVRAAETRARVLGSHFTLPSLGRVEATQDGFRWRPDG